jgi:hypothetical protein
MLNRLSQKVFFGLALSVALGVTVIAQNSSEQKLEFYLDGKVGSEVVKKGSYKVVIPEAEQGTIEIKVGKKVVTAPYVKRSIQNESERDKMTYVENADGSRTVATITPRGRKYQLVLSESAGNVASGKQ